MKRRLNVRAVAQAVFSIGIQLIKANLFVIAIFTIRFNCLTIKSSASKVCKLGLDKRRIKIELEDEEGGKYNLSLEGNISKSKVMKVFELMDMLDARGKDKSPDPVNHEYRSPEPYKKDLASIGARIWDIVENQFTYNSFTSSDVLEIYEHEFKEQTQLSIISTYLSRYSDRKKLVRTKNGKEWVYKIPRRAAETETETGTGKPLYEKPEPFSQHPLEQDFQSRDIN